MHACNVALNPQTCSGVRFALFCVFCLVVERLLSLEEGAGEGAFLVTLRPERVLV